MRCSISHGGTAGKRLVGPLAAAFYLSGSALMRARIRIVSQGSSLFQKSSASQNGARPNTMSSSGDSAWMRFAGMLTSSTTASAMERPASSCRSVSVKLWK